MNRRKRLQFWGSDEDDDHLVREIIERKKTVTVCPAEEFHVAEGDYDDGSLEKGDLVDIYDLRKRWRCTIEVMNVEKTLFGDIPEALWRGEYCNSADHFREAHRKCWSELNLTDDFELMATYFRLYSVEES